MNLSPSHRWVGVLLLLALLLNACQKSAEGPNVVLITLDTTRADRLGVMGREEAKTPVLDGLAARGTLFERAYASSPITLPSHTTMLTGLDPNLHQVHNNGSFLAPSTLETLAERLGARGYRTGAFVSAFVLDRAFGLDQGFDTYDDSTPREFEPPVVIIPTRDGRDTTGHALAWIRENAGGRPFFLWVHYFDVHVPRRAPAPFDKMADRYDGALAYVDTQVGRLLDGVEKAANGRETLTIVIGDHGESLGQHGELTHGALTYDSTLHVPLIVAGPGFGRGNRSKAFAKTADVTPTVLTAVGAPLPEPSSGRPLQSRLAGGSAEEEISYFETLLPATDFGWARLGGVRTDRWKLTAEPDPVELYDTLADPSESDDRTDQEPEVVARLTEAYREIRPPDPRDRPTVSPEVEEKLTALGYVSQPQRFEPGSEPDPRAAIHAYVWVERARSVVAEGRVADGIQALELFAQSPIAGPIAQRMLGPLYMRAGRYEDAVRIYRELAPLTQNIQIQIHLAGAMVMAGRPDDALTLLDEIEKSSPERASMLPLSRARAFLAAKRFDDAIREAAKVLAEDPWNDAVLAVDSAARAKKDEVAEIGRIQALLAKAPASERLVNTRGALAGLLHQRGRDREAREVLEAMSDPPIEIRALLADISAAHGDLERAAGIYEEIVSDLPEAVEQAQSLARIYAAMGLHEDSLKMYDRAVKVNPADAGAYVGRGAEHFRLGHQAEAESDYRKAISLDPSMSQAAFNLALLLLREKKEEEAEKWLLKAVEVDPDYAKAHYHLARLYHGRNDPRAALHAEKAAAASAASSSRSAALRGPGGAPTRPDGAAQVTAGDAPGGSKTR